LQAIIPGQARITTISASAGGNAERVLLQIAESKEGQSCRRIFSDWNGSECSGTIFYKSHSVPVILKRGVREGLFLRDDSSRQSFSLKEERVSENVIEIP